jgi:crotonobetainyl-CoA:carnitine CoA-transferase CaiB-like acyl-CoA transferase
MAPLTGIRVLELGTHLLVPAAGAILSEWGASVVKIEHPVTGDPARGFARMGPTSGTAAAVVTFQNQNRDKRSVALDFTNPTGRELLDRLLDASDVFLTSLLPDTRRRHHIDVDDVHARNPRIVYARGSGFGPHGPDSGRGAFDGTSYWFRGGVAATVTAPGQEQPPRPPLGIGDLSTAGFLAGGVAAALVERERTGRGPVVDASLFGSAMWNFGTEILAAHLTGGAETATPWTRANTPNPTANYYRTGDRRWLYLAMFRHDDFPTLCEAVGRSELSSDPRFATGDARYEYREACIAILDQVFATRTLSEWAEALDAIDAVWAPMQTPLEAFGDPQAVANRCFPEVVGADGSSFPVAAAPCLFDEVRPPATRAPELGEHTEEVLLELGCTWDEIGAFKQVGAIC